MRVDFLLILVVRWTASTSLLVLPYSSPTSTRNLSHGSFHSSEGSFRTESQHHSTLCMKRSSGATVGTHLSHRRNDRKRNRNRHYLRNVDRDRKASNGEKRRLLIFGNGNIAKTVTKYALLHCSSLLVESELSNNSFHNQCNQKIFDHVYCTTRSESIHPDLEGVTFIRLDTDLDSDSFTNTCPVSVLQGILSDCTHILVTIPPKFDRIKNGCFAYIDMILDTNYHEFIMPRLEDKWVGYVSTTGVYADHNNGWVNESSVCYDIDTITPVYSNSNCKSGHPAKNGGRRQRTIVNTKAQGYLDMEYRWILSIPHTCIFRLSGLYGDTTSALHTIINKGKAEKGAENEGYTSRIHLDDAGRAIVASMISQSLLLVNKSNMTEMQLKGERGSNMLNICDDEPELRSVIDHFAAELLSKKGIEFNTRVTLDISSERSARRFTSKKRVSNHKLMSVVLNQHGGLKYPSYREGLRAILKANVKVWKMK